MICWEVTEIKETVITRYSSLRCNIHAYARVCEENILEEKNSSLKYFVVKGSSFKFGRTGVGGTDRGERFFRTWRYICDGIYKNQSKHTFGISGFTDSKYWTHCKSLVLGCSHTKFTVLLA